MTDAMDDNAPLAVDEHPLSVEETTGYSKDLSLKTPTERERIAGIAGAAQGQVKGPHREGPPKK